MAPSPAVSKQFILVAVFFLGAGRFRSTTNQALLPAVVLPRCCRARRSLLGHDASRHHLGPGDRRAPLRGEPTFVYGICTALFLGQRRSFGWLRLPPVTSMTADTCDFLRWPSYIRQNRMLLGVIMLDLFAVLPGGATRLSRSMPRMCSRSAPGGSGCCVRRPRRALISLAVLTRTTHRTHHART
jgi:hypothetical protein